MSKLSSSQYNELRDNLRGYGFSNEVLKVLLSSANQVRTYEYYQKKEDLLLDYPPVTIPFSLLKDFDDVIQQDIKADNLKTSQNLREMLKPEIIPDNVIQKPTISDNVTKKIIKPKSKSNLASFSVRIDDLERQHLQDIADEFHVPLSTVFRWAIKDYLKQKRKVN